MMVVNYSIIHFEPVKFLMNKCRIYQNGELLEECRAGEEVTIDILPSETYATLEISENDTYVIEIGMYKYETHLCNNMRYSFGVDNWGKITMSYTELEIKNNSDNLVPCPACQHMVSKVALSCPNCGHPLSYQKVTEEAHRKSSGGGVLAFIAIIVGLILIFWAFSDMFGVQVEPTVRVEVSAVSP
jgi:hypothetical protein